MRRGTTPSYLLEIEGYDLRECVVSVTIKQGDKKLILDGERLGVSYDNDVSTIVFTLTQSETLDFKNGHVSIQVRWLDVTGYAQCTEIELIQVKPILDETVIGNE